MDGISENSGLGLLQERNLTGVVDHVVGPAHEELVERVRPAGDFLLETIVVESFYGLPKLLMRRKESADSLLPRWFIPITHRRKVALRWPWVLGNLNTLQCIHSGLRPGAHV